MDVPKPRSLLADIESGFEEVHASRLPLSTNDLTVAIVNTQRTLGLVRGLKGGWSVEAWARLRAWLRGVKRQRGGQQGLALMPPPSVPVALLAVRESMLAPPPPEQGRGEGRQEEARDANEEAAVGTKPEDKADESSSDSDSERAEAREVETGRAKAEDREDESSNDSDSSSPSTSKSTLRKQRDKAISDVRELEAAVGCHQEIQHESDNLHKLINGLVKENDQLRKSG